MARVHAQVHAHPLTSSGCIVSAAWSEHDVDKFCMVRSRAGKGRSNTGADDSACKASLATLKAAEARSLKEQEELLEGQLVQRLKVCVCEHADARPPHVLNHAVTQVQYKTRTHAHKDKHAHTLICAHSHTVRHILRI